MWGWRSRFSNKIAQNNGYHPVDVTGTGDIVLVPPQGGIHLPKQGVYENGVTGDPHIWALIGGKEIYLGRCVQGLKLNHLSVDALSPAFIQAILSSLDCSNMGSSINVDGSGSNGGLPVALVFRNSIKNPQHQGTGVATIGFNLLEGFPSVFKGTRDGVHGPGGNAHIFGQFSQGGSLFGPQFYAGRCKQLQ
jgi:hypothetical protein